MKNKKGFTLIELLAVIVILAIIALIAVPVIMNVINKARMSAFKDTAYGIISAGELYYAEQQLELNGMSEDTTFNLPADANTTSGIQIKGEIPEGTILKVNTNGETALAMSNGRYCVTKGYSDRDITIVEEYAECNIPTDAKTLLDLAVVSATLGVDSIASCLTDGTECAAGTAFAIKVNDTDTYKFRVLKEENNEVTLIMSENIGNNVSWIDSTDCAAAGGDSCADSPATIVTLKYGPLTALKNLKTRTSGWTNLEAYSYTLEDGSGNYSVYSGQYVQDVRARLPRLSDLITDAIGCTENDVTCPDWIYEGLSSSYGYWLSDSCAYSESQDMNTAYYVGNDGGLHVQDDMFNTISAPSGLRPVITLTK